MGRCTNTAQLPSPIDSALRRYLLVGILVPIAVFILGNTAYDRTLLALAKSIGELLQGEGDAVRVAVLL